MSWTNKCPCRVDPSASLIQCRQMRMCDINVQMLPEAVRGGRPARLTRVLRAANRCVQPLQHTPRTAHIFSLTSRAPLEHSVRFIHFPSRHHLWDGRRILRLYSVVCTKMSRMSSVTKDGGEQDGGKPKIIPSNYWDQQPIDSFSLGSDSDELYTSSWRYPDNKWFDSRVKSDFSCLQTALLAGIGKKSDTISLVGDSHLSQVPWHPSLLPSYQVSRWLAAALFASLISLSIVLGQLTRRFGGSRSML